MESLLVLIYGLFLPMVAYLIEFVTPYPAYVEEIVKFALVAIIRQRTKINNNKFERVLILGTAFALSEAIFYVVNFYLIGRLDLMAARFVETLALHCLTYLILIVGVTQRNKVWWIVALGGAILCHFGFNYFLFLG